MRTIIALWAVLFAMIGCGGDDPTGEDNSPPVIDQLIIPEEVRPGDSVELQVIAHDEDGDALTYVWDAAKGKLDSRTGQTVKWTVPSDLKAATVTVSVNDGVNEPVTQSRRVPIILPEEEVEPVADVPEARSANCQAGDIIRPGESCIHPNGDRFVVEADGTGRLGGIGSRGGITIRARNLTFVASKQADGSWVIEDVGGTPVADRPVDRCQIPPLNQDFGGKPVLFSGDGGAAVLLSDGNFAAVFIKSENGEIDGIGGAVQTATTALVQFICSDFLNDNMAQISDGKITEFEVARGIGHIELKENRTFLTVDVPEQDGDMIKGDFQFIGFEFWIRGPCDPDAANLVQPNLAAELTKYAKDLLDIMQENR